LNVAVYATHIAHFIFRDVTTLKLLS